MSNQILKVIAAAMMIGSFILIVIAYQTGKAPQSPVKSVAEQLPILSDSTIQVIKAAHTIHPNDVILESDLIQESATARPKGAFTEKAQIIGKRALFNIHQGAVVLQSHLSPDNKLTQALNPDERAIAIKVDEIIGVGGFILPGDVVDVVAFVRADHQRIEDPQAVVAIHAVRVLAYGQELPSANDAWLGENKEAIKGKKGNSTAILALKSSQTSLVSLLENAAVVRLALRPSNAPDSENKPYSVTIQDVIASNTNQSNTPKSTSSLQPKKSVGPMVEIYHGTHVEQIQYP